MLSTRSMALIVAAIGVIACHSTMKALTTSGTWAAQTVTGTQTINLTGNVTLTGQITVSGNLTINANGADRKIINNTSDTDNSWPNGAKKTDCMFYVTPTGKLTINGGDYWIDIDGQANNDWANGKANNHHLSSSGKFRMGDEGGIYRPLVYGGIYSSGTLTLNKCKVHDVNTKSITVDTKNDRYGTLRGYGAITICSFTPGKYSGTAGPTVTNITNCEIFENVNYYGAALMTRSCSSNTINISNTKIYHNVVRVIPTGAFPSGTAPNEWNGVIRTEGGSNAEMTLEDVEIFENYANGECSGIFFNANQLTMKHCLVHDNETERMGGGMRLETSFKFEHSDKGPTEVYNNISQTYGAGIHIFSYAGSNKQYTGTKNTFTYNINENLKVYDNETKASGYADGAGICFDFRASTTLAKESTMIANINGAKIYGNTAAGHGGGIYAWNQTPAAKDYKIEVNLNSGEINNNTANNGGGIYVNGLAITSTEDGTLTFSGNTANVSGGAVFVEDGSLNLKSISIDGNVATTMNGGGIYMKGKTSKATIESGNITGNKAPGTITNDGGNGGGMYLRDGAMTMLNGTITGNEAKNGGGICLNVGGNLTYKSGLIYRNRAISGGTKPVTAYQKPAGDLNGIGGGIYLGNNARLTFAMGSGTKLGIYDNYAEHGADDIFANGNGTSLVLPDVSNMDLSGTDAPVTKNTLLWMEDYIAGDTDYDQGTYKMGSAWTGNNNQRYRDAIAGIVKKYYSVPGGTYDSKYMSLALGYQYIFITLQKTGVPSTVKDNFMFDIYKGSEKYMTVLLRPDNYNSVTGAWERTVALPDGEWTIKEAPWSWAYKNKTGELTQDIRKNWTFTFENEIIVPPHLFNEGGVVNKIEIK